MSYQTCLNLLKFKLNTIWNSKATLVENVRWIEIVNTFVKLAIPNVKQFLLEMYDGLKSLINLFNWQVQN